MDNKEKILRKNLGNAIILGNDAIDKYNEHLEGKEKMLYVEDHEQALEDYLTSVGRSRYKTIVIEYSNLSDFDDQINNWYEKGYIYVDLIKYEEFDDAPLRILKVATVIFKRKEE